MDLVTQGLFGAAAAGACFGRRLGRHAIGVGLVAGLLPDADVLAKFIPGLVDPALPWEFHRHATHAMVAVPFIAAASILPWLCSARWRQEWKPLYGAAFVAAATHAPLDACTSFGTHLWWPFTDRRTAWDAIAIIDPMVTLPLLLGVIVAWWRSRSPLGWRAVQVGFALGVLALGLGFLQHHRARGVLETHIAATGETVERVRVMPLLGTTLVWRTLRESRDEAGARIAKAALVRVPYFGAPTLRDGDTLTLVEPESIEWADAATAARAARVFAELDRFSDDWLGYVGDPPPSTWAPFVLGDHRYSIETDGFAPLWGVAASPGDAVVPLAWVSLIDQRSATLGRLWREILGQE